MIELLAKKHNKKSLDCGNELLNKYIYYQAVQDVKRKLTACFVLTDATNKVYGYYTLSNSSIPLDIVPQQIQKKLPKAYSSVPVTLLGRLAVDIKYQKKGIGKILLVDALKRSYYISKEIGSFAVVVDPINTTAEKFYEKYGFVKLPDSGKMFIAIKTIKELFES